jgi:hypothetical protein
MEQMKILDPITLFEEEPETSMEAGYALSAVTVYRDARTRKWATEVCGRVKQLTGVEGIRSLFWRLGVLTQPRIFPGAVRAAATADVIIVSLYATDQLPLDFYSWVDEWLPRRRQAPSALVALIGVPDDTDLQASPIQEYLRSVARKGHLEFLPARKKLSDEFSGPTERERREEERAFLTASAVT